MWNIQVGRLMFVENRSYDDQNIFVQGFLRQDK